MNSQKRKSKVLKEVEKLRFKHLSGIVNEEQYNSNYEKLINQIKQDEEDRKNLDKESFFINESDNKFNEEEDKDGEVDSKVKSKASSNLEKSLQKTMDDLEGYMEKFAKSSGDKDGELDIKSEEEAFDLDDEENEEEVEEDDCFIYTKGNKEKAFCGNKHLGDFVEFDDALKAIKDWQEENNFFPNIWHVSDHGNHELVEEQKGYDESFSNFLYSEYGENPTDEEVGQAIINWSYNYMDGNNDGDFDGVSQYMNDNIWYQIKDDVSSKFIKELRSYVKGKKGKNIKKENLGIAPKDSDQIDEAVGALAGSLALSAPSITQMAGKVSSWLGKKLNTKLLSKVGHALEELGEEWHHKYEEWIYKIIKKMNPDVDDEKAKKASKAVLLSLIGTMAVASGSGAAELASKGKEAMAGAEAGLSGIKTSEIIQAISQMNPEDISNMMRKAIPKILPNYFG